MKKFLNCKIFSVQVFHKDQTNPRNSKNKTRLILTHFWCEVAISSKTKKSNICINWHHRGLWSAKFRISNTWMIRKRSHTCLQMSLVYNVSNVIASEKLLTILISHANLFAICFRKNSGNVALVLIPERNGQSNKGFKTAKWCENVTINGHGAIRKMNMSWFERVCCF